MQIGSARNPGRGLAVLVAAMALALGIAAGPLATQPARADGTAKMMLVLDSSGSMKDKLADHKTKIAAARGALDSVIAQLPADQQVGLRVYGATVFNHSDKGACTDSQKVVGLGTDNRAQLKAAVRKYKPYGETPTGYALQQAGRDLGTSGRRTIVLVSDGEPTCAPDPCTVAAKLADQGIDLTIDVVGLDVSGKARSMLKCIADKANGRYYDADSADDIDNALDTVATRAARPYQASGRPVSGSDQATGAPNLRSGDWLDKIGGVGRVHSDLFYTIHRTIPGSTLHVSASLTTKGKIDDGLRLRIFGNGTQCATSYVVQNGASGPIVSTSVDAPGYRDWDEKCTDNDTFTVEITRASGLNKTAATVPLEIRVTEEAPAADLEALPKELPTPSFSAPAVTTAHKTVGGSSFDGATAIKPGSYSGNIVPGEVQIFAVPVDWGQHLTAETVVNPISDKLATAMGNSNIWLLNTQLYSPSRAVVVNTSKSEPQRVVAKSGADSRTVTYPVVYRNRTSYLDSKQAANRAGNYYIAVSLSSNKGSESFQLPFSLNVAVDGTVQGKPTYLKHGATPSASGSPSAASATPSTAAATPDPTNTTTTTSPTAGGHPENSSGNRAGTIVHALGIGAGVIGGLAVVGGAVAIILIMRRRR